MAPQLPDGDPAPHDGALPAQAAVDSEDRRFGAYVHVPFCRVRCGYCDFNTYTATELHGAKQLDYSDEVSREIALAQHVLADARVPERGLSSIFFGGGTPTLLPSTHLSSMLACLRETFGIHRGAEVTTEANPDSVDAAYLAELAETGFTRVSFGMQSAVPRVLRTLDRTHDPERIPEVVDAAKRAGLSVSLDLIYGAPGETLEDWKRSVSVALEQKPDHISAYALIVEDGTKLARQIRRGELRSPDDDLQAEMYEWVDSQLESAGYSWYEVSNWSADSKSRSVHNLGYWTGEDWWGFGPGAHSHVGGVRWWNVKHPAAYAQRLALRQSPAHARETLDDETRRIEKILLETRISDGLSTDVLSAQARKQIPTLIAEHMIDGRAALRGKIVLTRRGRLLADAVVRALTD